LGDFQYPLADRPSCSTPGVVSVPDCAKLSVSSRGSSLMQHILPPSRCWIIWDTFSILSRIVPHAASTSTSQYWNASPLSVSSRGSSLMQHRYRYDERRRWNPFSILSRIVPHAAAAKSSLPRPGRILSVSSRGSSLMQQLR